MTNQNLSSEGSEQHPLQDELFTFEDMREAFVAGVMYGYVLPRSGSDEPSYGSPLGFAPWIRQYAEETS